MNIFCFIMDFYLLKMKIIGICLFTVRKNHALGFFFRSMPGHCSKTFNSKQKKTCNCAGFESYLKTPIIFLISILIYNHPFVNIQELLFFVYRVKYRLCFPFCRKYKHHLPMNSRFFLNL